MKPQLDNIIMSSALMWLDHVILKKGHAFTNYSSNFYQLPNLINGLSTYGLPFKQIVCDSSINGANLLSGVFINSTFTKIGENNLSGINPNQGQIYFGSQQNNTISGNYAVKDFNIYLTSSPEENILFETQYQTRNKTIQNPTGIAPNSMSIPAVFIKNNGGINDPYAFGGMDKTNIEIRALILSDSMFNLDGVTSILRDTSRSYIPLIQNSPYNSIGSLNNGFYNYKELTQNIDVGESGLFISEVTVSKILNIENKLNPNTFPGIVDFSLEYIRYPN